MYQKSNIIRKIARAAKLFLLSGGVCVAVIALTYTAGQAFANGMIDAVNNSEINIITYAMPKSALPMEVK